MKLGLAISLLSSFMCLRAYAQGAQPGTAGVVAQQPNQALQAVINEMPKVQDALKKCYDDGRPDVSACLWEKLDDGTKNEVRDKIQQAQEAELAATGDSQNSVNLRSTVSGARIGTVAKNAQDDAEKKALQKLGDFYGKRLDEAFKSTDGKISVTDQQVFFELAKTQLGKNVISAWSAVCMDAGWTENGKLVILKPGSANYTDLRKKNIDSLQTTQAAGDSTAGQILSGQFFKCAAHLPMLCRLAKGKPKAGGSGSGSTEAKTLQVEAQDTTKEIDYSSYSIPKDKPIKTMSQRIDAFTTEDDSSKMTTLKKNSQQRACETVAYVDGLRRQLAATEKLNTIMQNDATDGDGLGVVEEKRAADVDIDRLTTITSGDVVAEDSYYGAIQANSQLIETCKQNPDDGQCINLIANTDEEKARIRASGAAFMLETEILKEKLLDETTGTIDPAKLAQLSEEEKKSLVRRLDPSLAVDEINIDATLTKISSAYFNERAALVESLAQRVRDMEGSSDPDQLKQDIGKAGDRILNRGNEYVQLMHFNNVISGYFSVEGGKTNIRVLDLELENVANLSASSSGGNNSGMSNFRDANYANTLRQNIQQQNEGIDLGGSDEQNEIINLRSDQIGQFLDYEITQ
tara:strand:+ start:6234 stop:8129 length:1896 start_codon:yes stop_codon:yes gene_type:complete